MLKLHVTSSRFCLYILNIYRFVHIFICTYRGTHTQAHLYNQHKRGMATTRHRSLLKKGRRKALLKTLHKKPTCSIHESKEKIRAHTASRKLLDYFLRSNKSNINQCRYCIFGRIDMCSMCASSVTQCRRQAGEEERNKRAAYTSCAECRLVKVFFQKNTYIYSKISPKFIFNPFFSSHLISTRPLFCCNCLTSYQNIELRHSFLFYSTCFVFYWVSLVWHNISQIHVRTTQTDNALAHAYIHTHIYICMIIHVSTCTRIYVYLYTHTHAQTRAYTHAHKTHTHAYMHTHTYTYTHTPLTLLKVDKSEASAYWDDCQVAKICV